MAIIFSEEPELNNPILIASWPGTGNIGIIAANYLIQMTNAREFAEIEPWDFFEPQKAVIRGGLLENLEFPSSKFYFQRTDSCDLIIFIGEQQPSEALSSYPRGRKPLELANLVIDVAQKFGCRRAYIPTEAIAPVHHSMKPRVWAVPNSMSLVSEVENYENALLMSKVDQSGSHSTISGMNGLLLGLARKRNLEAICLMGEIPVYLQGLTMTYPNASKSVLEVLVKALGITIDFNDLNKTISQVGKAIKDLERQFYQQAPPEMAERIRSWVESFRQEPAETSEITDQDANWLKEHIEDLFGKGGQDNERPL